MPEIYERTEEQTIADRVQAVVRDLRANKIADQDRRDLLEAIFRAYIHDSVAHAMKRGGFV